MGEAAALQQKKKIEEENQRIEAEKKQAFNGSADMIEAMHVQTNIDVRDSVNSKVELDVKTETNTGKARISLERSHDSKLERQGEEEMEIARAIAEAKATTVKRQADRVAKEKAEKEAANKHRQLEVEDAEVMMVKKTKEKEEAA